MPKTKPAQRREDEPPNRNDFASSIRSCDDRDSRFLLAQTLASACCSQAEWISADSQVARHGRLDLPIGTICLSPIPQTGHPEHLLRWFRDLFGTLENVSARSAASPQSCGYRTAYESAQKKIAEYEQTIDKLTSELTAARQQLDKKTNDLNETRGLLAHQNRDPNLVASAGDEFAADQIGPRLTSLMNSLERCVEKHLCGHAVKTDSEIREYHKECGIAFSEIIGAVLNKQEETCSRAIESLSRSSFLSQESSGVGLHTEIWVELDKMRGLVERVRSLGLEIEMLVPRQGDQYNDEQHVKHPNDGKHSPESVEFCCFPGFATIGQRQISGEKSRKTQFRAHVWTRSSRDDARMSLGESCHFVG